MTRKEYVAVFAALLVGFLAAFPVASRLGRQRAAGPPEDARTGESSALPSRGPFRVARVVDGDTVILDTGETVRLIGVDAPEIHHPEVPVQRFGKESAAFLKSLVEGRRCTLSCEPGNLRDRYGRLLAYLFVDGRCVNAEMIRRGYAYAYTGHRYGRREEFMRLEREARARGWGLWNFSLTDGRIANLVTRYESLDLEGRRELDRVLERLSRGRPLSAPGSAARAERIDWRDAARHVGRYVEVEGRVVRAYNSGKACFLNFHTDYRKHLNIVIFSSAFHRFPGPPEELYRGKKIRVRGRVKEYKGRPEIVVEDPDHIVIEK